MNRSSEFIKNKALFGSYPTQEYVEEFEKLGVRYFVNLVRNGEKHTTPYETNYTYIHYPIHDRRIPTNWKSFAQFIIRLVDIIKNLPAGEKLYLHCKGGHGRSGIVVACILCYMYNISPSDAIAKTTKYHGRRKEMREKWRKMGSPQTRSQKHFVTRFFDPLYIYQNHNKYFSARFGNDAKIEVEIPGVGVFPTARDAYKYFEGLIKKDPDGLVSKFTTNSWDELRKPFMYQVLKHKFSQHEELRNNLTETGLRPIIVLSSDPFWGKKENTGRNNLGKLLEHLRKNLYKDGDKDGDKD